ncbi:MAG TPA: asparagine synthase (glutamine-hydrolyzing) [Phycisphaerae bacterium]|nr:asparagine synthase (glutamine-hydrolyzing) [Phycisphaerae bacterium]
MCGICGYVGDNRPELLELMCAAMVHRGPDDVGVWHDTQSEVGLGLRRLSIIDLSPAGHQPMCNEDGTVWISYNGEVYNFQELREDLLKRGHTFRGRSDTEVLVHLYEEKGPDFLKELNGMFGLAIWDARQKQLLLARDHAGIKPLYYWLDGRRLFFASEMRALLRVPGLPRELNADAVPLYLTLLYVPGAETMLKAIKKVEPGHYLIWGDGRIEERRWFSMAYEPDESVTEAEWVEQVHDTFMRVTRRQMVSDVPLGAFLSGGLDSSAIVACMRHSFPDREIKCYTYDYGAEDEARDQFERDFPYAQQVAGRLNVTLESFLLKPEISLLPRMVFAVEEPDAATAVFASYLISKLAREDGTTVLLSGMGGDEVLFGYRGHLAMRAYERLDWIPKWLSGPALAAATSLASATWGASSAMPRRLRKFRRALLGDGLERHMALSDWSSPEIRKQLFRPEFAESTGAFEGGRNPLRKYYDDFTGTGSLNRRSHVLIPTFLGAHNFLYVDKSSMAASVEVRVPFVDLELMRLCARIPERHKLKGRTTKYLLKAAMERHLPAGVVHRSGKTGFGPPLRSWVVGGLDPVIREMLSPANVRARGFFEPQAIEQIVRENRQNKADYAYLIYCLIVLEVWLRTFLDRPGEEVSL